MGERLASLTTNIRITDSISKLIGCRLTDAEASQLTIGIIMIRITLELSCETEAKLRESLARHDATQMRQLLAEAFTSTVEALLQQTSEPSNDDQFELIADQLAAEFAACVGSDAPLLSDFVRYASEGIVAVDPTTI